MLTVDINNTANNPDLPANEKFVVWARAAYLGKQNAELALSIVDSTTIQALNQQYRNLCKPTNVLSFPADASPVDGVVHLGDIVLCDSVIEQEATEQHKKTQHHWAHMVVHGMLHLQNYDHIDDNEAAEMESLETQILQTLGITNPYLSGQTGSGDT